MCENVNVDIKSKTLADATSAAGMTDGKYWQNGFLSRDEMRALDALDLGLMSGCLGRADGWSVEDIRAADSDPTASVD
jgi:hypothetical protein